MKPQAAIDYGEDIFIKIPLYKAQKKYKAVYINKNLFKICFKDVDLSFAHMSEVIDNKFSTTIDASKAAGKAIGEAYVDMQADPLGIALSGNLGSGRAFYQDGIFNIKGEKTPLAQSTKPEYSNGVLEFEKAIYETVASNSLYQDTNISLAPILAVLDINENCRVSWKSRVCKRAKIIRVDLNGALNRISHLFKAEIKPTKKELENFAVLVGRLEGEKYIQRIIHGAWSVGNISLKADMIDFDTVCTVKYRAPQHSFCPWYYDNYFGNEYLGQLKILDSLTIKPNKALHKLLVKTRQDYILNNFYKLMGLSSFPANRQLRSLVKTFMRLSAKAYPIFEDFNTKVIESFNCGVFDFSNFFRCYPILKNREKFEIYDALNLLLPEFRKFPNFNLKDYDRSSFENNFFYTHVLKKMDKNLVHNLDELLFLAKDCIRFIERYDKLYTKYSKDRYKEEKKAYIFNTDRENLTMVKSIAGPIDDCKDELSNHEIHQTIEATIASNKRYANISNMKVFKNGIFYVEHSNNGKHRLCLKNYDITGKNEVFKICINGKISRCKFTVEDGSTLIKSCLFDNINLLQYKEISFFFNSKKIKMKNFIFSFTNEPLTENFVF